jgi:hypothetical protein
MPHHVVIAAYNSAGELVKSLYSGAASVLPGQLDLGSASLGLGVGGLQMGFPGTLADGSNVLVWNGKNDGDQDVSGGAYYIKMETKDSFGKVTSVIYAVQVVDASPTQFLAVHNSAGERVREIPLPGNLVLNGFKAENEILLLGPGSAQGSMKISLRGAGGSVYSADWDGKNDAGSIVDAGVYSLVLISRQAGTETRVDSKGVQVLRAPGGNPALEARLHENPLPPSSPALRLSYPHWPGATASAVLYNLAGERVAEGVGYGGGMSIGAGHLSSGIYLLRLEIKDGPSPAGQATFKAAILR